MSLLKYMHTLPVLCVAHKYKIHLTIFTLQECASLTITKNLAPPSSPHNRPTRFELEEKANNYSSRPTVLQMI